MDQKFMKRAIELSKKGIGYTSPNPLVGAVIVKDGTIIGEGYHEVYGSHHAEVNAFKNATEDVTGATMYVTLEPCSHYGKTPPCADLIVKKKIKEVVIALKDPNPLVSGRGIKILEDNGIKVTTGILESECRKVNEIFLHYITKGTPFCILKTAMTLDGKIATKTGHSKWITGDSSRKHVHKLRHQVSAIMVGIDTVIEDNPLLTTRLEKQDGRDPIRVIVDTTARIPLDANVLSNDSSAATIIATTERAPKDKIELLKDRGADVIVTRLKNNRVDLQDLLNQLGERKIDSVLIEGGSTLNYSLLQEGLIHKVMTYIAPKLIGGSTAKTPVGGQGVSTMDEALHLQDIQVSHFDEDIMIEGYIKHTVKED
ncbi:bifunctional diaminohydroxyphosphoribosylaminopyrimidine deaminase/5-amino-6-(5-phosphoribosylamino)uracil reductase RibD [Haloplasma contractile]|uniref:Riboflavin biosynthesis protein RibD n=1 Tax=Haloplasma contractile SSD-17B TaxID=1033810 RepID=F7Q1M1_9MOLU|nr:bifunctional diaminohydroxyphosphoribosylaminopyrimidine deaminase/5-amino-6-(5-phosphoribosylamino)uracil reductase RibD [Haloplasma contractile]ERJ12951.1 Riboflavin biosynthesis protein RibD [Haloplasma contractile SSD-17B]